MSETTDITLKNKEIPDMGGIFATPESFNNALAMATSLSKSTVIPKEFQGNPSNCVIAVDMAFRTKMSPMMVMQNLYIVNGRPSWSSQFITALINNSRRFAAPLKFRMEGKGESLTCYAWTMDLTGEVVEGPKITMEIAKKEGWISRNGSKWQTMPEVMIQYRAASFFGRMHCPDLLMGLYGEDEAAEMPDPDPVIVPSSLYDEEEIEGEVNVSFPDHEAEQQQLS